MNEVQKKRVELMKENIVDACRSKGISVEDLLEAIINLLGKEPPPGHTPETTSKPKTEAKKSIEYRIMKLFREIGIPVNIKGYEYIKESIIYVLEKGNVAVTKELYPYVAKKYGTTSSRVERAIRHAIIVAWNRGNPDVLEKYFGFTIDPAKNQPTNSEFIYMIAEVLKIHAI